MHTLRSALVVTAGLFIALPPLAVAQSSSIDLLNLTVSKAQVIAGANVNAAKASPFGQYLLGKIQPSDPRLQEFIANTGFDPLNDVSEVVLSTDSTPGPSAHWTVAARGNFGMTRTRVEDQAKNHGATISTVSGVELIDVVPDQNTQAPHICIAFWADLTTAAIGDCASVQAAILQAQQTPSGALISAAQTGRAAQDFWFASVLPLPKMAPTAPAGAPNPAAPVLNNPLFQKIQQTSGGVKFAGGNAPGVQATGAIVMDTPEDATSLLNVANFFLSMVQGQLQSAPGAAAGTATSLLKTLMLTQNGATVNVSLTIPEQTLEQMFEMAHQAGTQAEAHAQHRRR